MKQSLEILSRDPKNVEAHSYLNLVGSEMDREKRSVQRDARLRLLEEASLQMDNKRWDTTSVQKAIQDAAQAEDQAQNERWRALCDEAILERELGHLLVANDLVFKILADNPNYIDAQREQSELQSRMRQALDTGSGSVLERYAIEGFYAFGQADYAAAAAAWKKARDLLHQLYPVPEISSRLSALHFESYEQTALKQVEEANRVAETHTLFENGLRLYQAGQFSQAAEAFRQVAIRNPEYPQLAYHLIEAEAAEEKDKTRRLSEEKRQQIAGLFQTGLTKLEQSHYGEAQTAFKEILALDPLQAQAQSYLLVAQAEIQRRHDPKAAQQHYETGLVAYASGKLEDAVREWRIATRMDPQHVKASNALNKVQRELALNREAL